MDNFEEKLNDFLTSAFNGILKSQEQVIRQLSNSNISISELHLIEAADKCGEGRNTVSEIAQILDITNSSVTIAVNKLVVKGFLKKVKNENDRRSVYVELTEKGNYIKRYHEEYHKNMIKEIASTMTEEEKKALITGMKKLDAFFDQSNFKNFIDNQNNLNRDM